VDTLAHWRTTRIVRRELTIPHSKHIVLGRNHHRHPDSFDGSWRERVSYILHGFRTRALLRLASRLSRLDLVRAFSPQTMLLAVRADGSPPVPDGRACSALDRAEKLAASITDRG
jgi:hypothetical protein